MEKEIAHIVENLIEDEHLFLVDVRVKGNLGNQKVLVFVDGDDGISIDACSRISRKLGLILEEEDMISGKYTLEVSSPGADFPLKLARQYHKHIGRTLEIEIKQTDKIEGELLKVTPNTILISKKTEEVTIPFENIEQAKVKISFK